MDGVRDLIGVGLFMVLCILLLMPLGKDLKNMKQAKLERAAQAKELAKEATVPARVMKDLGDEYIYEWYDNESVVFVHGKFFHLEHNEYNALKRVQREKRDSVYRIDYDRVETTAAEKNPR